jgi:crotonobetainyl-CoA:carnitine CoA-transferase CaiB-like acyl-CoA transferase
MGKRAENAKDLVPLLDKVFASQPRDYWMSAFKKGGDFIYTVVNSIDDLMRDEQMLTNDYIVDYEHPRIGKTKIVGFPVRLSETPGDPRGAAPEFGEHTELLLTELLDYSWEDVARLKEAEVI